jgi:hypothetical protein
MALRATEDSRLRVSRNKLEARERNLTLQVRHADAPGSRTFTCRWINRLDQFGTTNIDLLVTHDDGLIPEQRISKKYRTENYDSLDADFFATQARIEVDRIMDDRTR